QIEVLRRKSDPGTAPLGPGGRGLRPAPGTGDPAGRDPGARRCAGRRLRPDPQGLAAVGDAGDRGAVETDRLAGARLTCPKPSAWPAKRPSATAGIAGATVCAAARLSRVAAMGWRGSRTAPPGRAPVPRRAPRACAGTASK